MYNEILSRLDSLIIEKIKQRNRYAMRPDHSKKILSDIDFNIDTLEIVEGLLRKLMNNVKQSEKKQPKTSKYLQDLKDYHLYTTGRPLPHF